MVDNAWGDCLDGCPGTRKHIREAKASLRLARPRMGSLGHMGQYSVWPGTFWGFLNISLHASSAQLGLDIVDQMCVHLRMG